MATLTFIGVAEGRQTFRTCGPLGQGAARPQHVPGLHRVLDLHSLGEVLLVAVEEI